jgi:hypothetical protein
VIRCSSIPVNHTGYDIPGEQHMRLPDIAQNGLQHEVPHNTLTQLSLQPSKSFPQAVATCDRQVPKFFICMSLSGCQQKFEFPRTQALHDLQPALQPGRSADGQP